jgi:3-oxoadipate enol-lactonase
MKHTTLAHGLSVAYADVGQGDEVVLFVHGHPFDHSMWQPQLDALPDAGWRAIAPDLRGYGASALVTGKTTLDVFADDLAALLDHLGIAQVVACGLSMGGQIVMALADRHPSRVRGLVLAATFPRQDTDEGRQNRLAMADRLEREGMDGYANEVLAKMLAPQSIDALPDVAAHVTRMMRSAPPAGAAAALRGRAERPDYAPTLARFDRPALVIVGDEDVFTTRADAEQMHALLKRSELVWMPGAGHMPNLERADEFNAALLRFLGSTTSAGR